MKWGRLLVAMQPLGQVGIFKNPFCYFHLCVFSLFAGTKMHKRTYNVLFATCVGFVLVLSMFFEAAKFFTTEITSQLVIEIVPSFSVLVATFFYLCYARVYGQDHRTLIAMVGENSVKERCQAETNILKKYENFTAIFITATSVLCVLGSLFMLFLGFIPYFLDLISPINGTRPRVLPFVAEHFVNDEDYFYPLLFFEILSVVYVIVVIVSAECMFVIVTYHACAVVSMMGCRIKNLVPEDDNRLLTTIETETLQGISDFVLEHYDMMKFVSAVNNCTGIVLLFMLGTTLISLSTTLVKVTNVELVDMKSVMFAFAQVFQFFIVSVMGQLLINASSKLPDSVYSALWYNCSPRLRRLFALLILRSHKPFVLEVSSMYTVSLHTFSTVIQTALSYCMVLRQLQ